jgi:hypothetical protein
MPKEKPPEGGLSMLTGDVCTLSLPVHLHTPCSHRRCPWCALRRQRLGAKLLILKELRFHAQRENSKPNEIWQKMLRNAQFSPQHSK